MPCETQHAYTYHNRRQLRHVNLRTIRRQISARVFLADARLLTSLTAFEGVKVMAPIS